MLNKALTLDVKKNLQKRPHKNMQDAGARHQENYDKFRVIGEDINNPDLVLGYYFDVKTGELLDYEIDFSSKVPALNVLQKKLPTGTVVDDLINQELALLNKKLEDFDPTKTGGGGANKKGLYLQAAETIGQTQIDNFKEGVSKKIFTQGLVDVCLRIKMGCIRVPRLGGVTKKKKKTSS